MMNSGLKIDWQGPLQGKELFRAIDAPHGSELDYVGLYISVQKYPRYTILYAGKVGRGKMGDRTFKNRWQEHLNNFRYFGYNIHVDDPRRPTRAADGSYLEKPSDPTYLFKGGARKPEDPDELSRLRAAADREIALLEFYYCRFPALDGTGISDINFVGDIEVDAAIDTVEADLIECLYALEDNRTDIATDNSRGERRKLPISINREAFTDWALSLVGGGEVN